MEQLKLEREARKDESVINKNNRASTVAPVSYEQKLNMQAAANDEAYQRRQAQEKQNKLNAVKISDFDLADAEIVPTQKDAEQVKKINGANKNFERTATEIKALVGEMTKEDYLGFTQRAKLLKQKIGEARLQQKEIKNLGVLNGPDLPLVDTTLGQIDSMSTLAILGNKNAQARMDEAIKNSKNNLLSEASARGYKPRMISQSPVTPNNQGNELRAELEQRRALKAQQQAGG
jgi:hypothetical protein